jgi:hypothetical protein
MLGLTALALAATGVLVTTAARAGSPFPGNGVNGRGETYGIMRDHDPQPDLIAVVGLDQEGREVEGYVPREALFSEKQPPNPAEALRMQAASKSRDVPMYAADGLSVVGSFHITGANEMVPGPPVPLP